ncbi:Translation initiation factor [Rhizoctonia solani]|uniref:Methylthioribose-1-phosphate isomerase n=2 Tax=Rhizoctonia solani TaxID=456999 RepID=A0A8H7M814_9AGAM|nr:Translation initiation factor [Rhizoctonia solani]
MTIENLLTSLRTDGDKITIIDQLLLPHQEKWIEVDSIEAAYDAIKSMKIRGAPAIASLAALSLASHLSIALKSDPQPAFLASPNALRDHVLPQLSYLYSSRPTAVNLGAATRRLQNTLQAGLDAGHSAEDIANALVKEGRAVADEDFGRNREMSKHGAEWLVERVKAEGGEASGLNVMTVCNTGSLATSGYGTALGLITHLFEQGQLGKAYFTQTAPYHQGTRLTAMELVTIGAPCAMLCDNMVGSLFQNQTIHAVAVGADRVARNGDTANKVGTYNAAVIAARHNIPFIVVAPVSTIDLDTPDGSKIPIEQRPGVEACLVRGAVYPPSSSASEPELTQVLLTPPALNHTTSVYNPAFDVTPAELITAIVTEKGVAVRKPGQLHFDLSVIT